MQIFIDTNVFLSFYYLSKDDLEELQKLKALLENSKATLLLPRLVMEEFSRNRETQIADALKSMQSLSLALQYPQIARNYPQYKHLRKLQKDFEKQRADLLERIREDVFESRLSADNTIRQLFHAAEVIEYSSDLIERARTRRDIGNPPGKRGSMRDALNWECLLQAAADGEDLRLVSEDGDYASVLSSESIDPFLGREWKREKSSDVILFRRLGAFFSVEYPNIKFAVQLERNLAMRRYVESGAFATTHLAVRKLSSIPDFTDEEVNELAIATILNSQIHDIATDDDIREFIQERLLDSGFELDPVVHDRLVQMIGDGPSSASGGADFEDDVPF